MHLEVCDELDKPRKPENKLRNQEILFMSELTMSMAQITKKYNRTRSKSPEAPNLVEPLPIGGTLAGILGHPPSNKPPPFYRTSGKTRLHNQRTPTRSPARSQQMRRSQGNLHTTLVNMISSSGCWAWLESKHPELSSCWDPI